jgi:hypothetical protein
MSFYDDMQIVASDVLSEFAQGSVSYIPIIPQPGATPDNPLPPVDGTPVALSAVVRPVSTKYVDGSHIVQSDRQVTFAAGVVTPDITGFVDIDGVRYKIVEIMPTPAAGTVVSYTLIVRR